MITQSLILKKKSIFVVTVSAVLFKICQMFLTKVCFYYPSRCSRVHQHSKH